MVAQEILDLIEDERRIAFLATAVDGHPHVVPFWYDYEAGSIRITTDGMAAKNVQRNDRAAVSIQHDVDGRPQWMVAVRGTAIALDDETTIRRVTERIYRKYLGTDQSEWPREYRENLTTINPDRVIIDVEIESVTHRMFDED